MTTASSAETTRRDFLYIATAVVGAVGGAAALVPLIAQMNPDASTVAAGAPIEVDLAPIADNQAIKVFWRSKPIYIWHRTKEEIQQAQNVDVATLPDPQSDPARVKDSCVVDRRVREAFGGFFCHHGSQTRPAASVAVLPGHLAIPFVQTQDQIA